jgi:hypothetical protein
MIVDNNGKKLGADLHTALNGGGSPVMTIEHIYEDMYLRDWEREFPSTDFFKENTTILWGSNNQYILFHKKHPKFGLNIIEAGDNFYKNLYVFFDYDHLKKIIKWMEKTEEEEEWPGAAPAVPTHYALPEDRHFFGTQYQQWEDEILPV